MAYAENACDMGRLEFVGNLSVEMRHENFLFAVCERCAVVAGREFYGANRRVEHFLAFLNGRLHLRKEPKHPFGEVSVAALSLV